MRKIIALILLSSIALSCSNKLEFNTSVFQGVKNYDFWGAEKFQAAFTNDGGVKIIGINNHESLTLILNDISEGVYTLGTSEISSAVFEDKDLTTYSTFNNGDGEIIIEDYNSEELTITGTFKFNSYSENGELVNFTQGIFYKTPIENVVNELTGSNTFSASVNSVVDEINVVNTNVYGGGLHIAASYLNGTSLELYMPENIQIGSYNLNASTQIYANYVFVEGAIASSQYGTLTILEHDTQFKKLKATFLFNTGNPYNVAVSNGIFIVYY